MATKPAAAAIWATDTNYPAGPEPEAGTPTKVAVTSEQETIGWRPGEEPTAQIMNDWQNNVSRWTAYLNDGLLDGDHEIDGNLTVKVNLTVEDDVQVDGAVDVDGIATVNGALVTGPNADSYHEGDRYMSFEGRVVTGFDNHGAGSLTSSEGNDENWIQFDTVGNSVRYPCHGLRVGDRVHTVWVTYESSGGYPDVDLIINSHTGGAVTIKATTTGGGDFQVFSGRTVRCYVVTAPAKLANVLGIAPILFPERCGVRVTSQTIETKIHAVAIAYDHPV